MSEMEESDPEAMNLKTKRKSNGYTYYGTEGDVVGSTLKLFCCIFTVAFLFLAAGLILGYHAGFREATSTLWHHFRANPIPDGPVNAPKDAPFRFVHDHFATFKRGGVRYGADYGHHTIHSVRATRSLLQTEGNTTDLCGNRRCCHPTNGVSDAEGQQCWDLTRSECCDRMAQDICDWNCEEDVPNVREDHIVRDGRKRNKLCGGHSDRTGVFADVTLDEVVPDSGPPRNASELQARNGVMTQDECGDLFVNLIDDETAEYEMEHFGELGSEALSAEDDQAVRRMQDLIFDSDSREDMMSTSYPQSEVGLVTMGEYLCSGTKISKKHVLTNGHCCFEYGGSWIYNWVWYPGVTTKDEVDSSSGYSVGMATTFSAWINDQNWGYDLCWLTLHSSYIGHLGFGWHTGITSSWQFNLWGYPTDKYTSDCSSGECPIKWGHDDCTPNKGVETETLRYDCDIWYGMSGSGLWLSNNVVYCVHSFGSTYHNGCARITSDKFNTMYDHMLAGGGWS